MAVSSAGGGGAMEPDESSRILDKRKASSDVSRLICEDEARPLSKPGSSLGSSSLSSTAFNYVNSIIGSGIIGTPFALRQSGLALGLVTLCMVAVFTDRSLVLLVKAGNISGQSTYQDLMAATFGFPGYVVLTLFQFMYPFIAMISYNVIAGDTVTRILVRATGVDPMSPFARREFVTFLTTVLVTLPLSLYRDLGKLAKVSLMSLVLIVFIAVSVFIRFFTMSGALSNIGNITFFDFYGYSDAFGIMTFAYMCHHNSFLLYSALEGASQSKWERVTHLSISTSFVAMVAFAVGGYVTFLDATQGDLLNNYCWADDLMNAARLFFTVTIMLTYPIECFVCREVVENILFQRIGLLAGGEDEAKWKNSTLCSHLGITLCIVGLTFLGSLITDCLGVVLILNGLFFAIPLAYVLPGAIYLKLTWGGCGDDSSSSSRWDRPMAAILIAFGLVAAIHGLVLLALDGVPDCAHDDVEMPYCTADHFDGANSTLTDRRMTVDAIRKLRKLMPM